MKSNCLCTLLLIISLSTQAQKITSLSLDFNRSVFNNSRAEELSGHVFFFDTTTFVKVIKPINQWLIYKGKSIVIYYPDKNNAIFIKGSSPAILPFFHSILGLVDDNINLDKLHYTIIKSEKIKDTLKITWQPPKEIRGGIGNYRISFTNDRISCIENFDNKGKIISKTNYKDYKKIDNKYFPTNSKTYTYINKRIDSEENSFYNIAINKEIPIEIKNFKIPADSKIQEIEW